MITVYGKENCPNCDTAKNILVSKGVQFDYVDVAKNEDALHMLKKMGARSVPVVMDGDVFIGEFAKFKAWIVSGKAA